MQQDDIVDRSDVAHIELGIAVHIGLHGIVTVDCLAQYQVDDCGHVAHVDAAVGIGIALQRVSNGLGMKIDGTCHLGRGLPIQPQL